MNVGVLEPSDVRSFAWYSSQTAISTFENHHTTAYERRTVHIGSMKYDTHTGYSKLGLPCALFGTRTRGRGSRGNDRALSAEAPESCDVPVRHLEVERVSVRGGVPSSQDTTPNTFCSPRKLLSHHGIVISSHCTCTTCTARRFHGPLTLASSLLKSLQAISVSLAIVITKAPFLTEHWRPIPIPRLARLEPQSPHPSTSSRGPPAVFSLACPRG
mmetsp:Transcript_24623/g.56050  ORF Transcript_24623/g.56050 Transcript_24623/m.56050 type:complete len:215 (+) Transcript_24623:240-884(+)